MLVEQLYKKKKERERVHSAIKKFDSFEERSTKKIAKKVVGIFHLTFIVVILLILFELVFIGVMPYMVKLGVFCCSVLSLVLVFVFYEHYLINKNNERIEKRKKQFISKKEAKEKDSSINKENIDALFDEIIMMRENNIKIDVPNEFIYSIVDFKETLMDLDLDSKINNVIDKKERLNATKSNKIINT